MTSPAASSATRRFGALVGRRPRPVRARPTVYASSIVGREHHGPGVMLALRVGEQARGVDRDPGCAARRRAGRCARPGAAASTSGASASVSGASISSRRRRMASSGLVGAAADGSAAGGVSGGDGASATSGAGGLLASATGDVGAVGRRRRGRGAACSARSWANTSPGSVPGSGAAGAADGARRRRAVGGARGAAAVPEVVGELVDCGADALELGQQRGTASLEVVEHPLAHGARLVDHLAPLARPRLPRRRGALAATRVAASSPVASSGSGTSSCRGVVARRGACHWLDAIGAEGSPRVCPSRRAHRRDDGARRARRPRSSP